MGVIIKHFRPHQFQFPHSPKEHIMQVETLTIERAPSYSDDAGRLRGVLKLSGDTGQVVVKLSPGIIAQILTLVRGEAIKTARANAAEVSQTIINASNEHALEQSATIAIKE
jgi:hypothetical protein